MRLKSSRRAFSIDRKSLSPFSDDNGTLEYSLLSQSIEVALDEESP
jgi:hypothetical protein